MPQLTSGTPPAASPGWISFGNLGKAIAALALAVVLALTAAGGTYAYLSDTETVVLNRAGASVTPTLTTGTATLAISGSPAIVALYPGSPRRTTTFTVTNTGTVPLSLAVDTVANTQPAATLSTSITLGLLRDVSAANCVAATPSWQSPIVGHASGDLNTIVQPASSVPFCLSATLALDAPAAARSIPAAFTVTIIGRQV